MGVPPGRYRLFLDIPVSAAATHPGLVGGYFAEKTSFSTADVVVVPNTNIVQAGQFNIHQGGQLSMTVVDDTTGQPIDPVGAGVTPIDDPMQLASYSFYPNMVAGNPNIWTLFNLRYGRFRIGIYANGYLPAVITQTINSPDLVNLGEIRLKQFMAPTSTPSPTPNPNMRIRVYLPIDTR